MAGQALSFIQDLVAALLNFHSYTEQRVHIYPRDSSIEPISPLNQKVRWPHAVNTEHIIINRIQHNSFLSLVFSVSTWKCSLCAPPGGQLSAITPKHHRRYCHSPGDFLLCYYIFFRDCVCGLIRDACLVLSSTYRVFICFELKETVVKLKSFADNFSSYTHFLQKILPYQLKRSALCIFVLAIEKWSRGGGIDDYLLLSAWRKSAQCLFVLLPLLPKTRSCRMT